MPFLAFGVGNWDCSITQAHMILFIHHFFYEKGTHHVLAWSLLIYFRTIIINIVFVKSSVFKSECWLILSSVDEVCMICYEFLEEINWILAILFCRKWKEILDEWVKLTQGEVVTDVMGNLWRNIHLVWCYDSWFILISMLKSLGFSLRKY